MKSGSTPLPVCRNSVLFDNSLNDKRFRIDIRMENGYEEGCTRGASILCFHRSLFHAPGSVLEWTVSRAQPPRGSSVQRR